MGPDGMPFADALRAAILQLLPLDPARRDARLRAVDAAVRLLTQPGAA
ncbi:hypothetical protein [Nonomuraea candida]|nr:hypothetical protein [Nonomuraea candida]